MSDQAAFPDEKPPPFAIYDEELGKRAPKPTRRARAVKAIPTVLGFLFLTSILSIAAVSFMRINVALDMIRDILDDVDRANLELWEARIDHDMIYYRAQEVNDRVLELGYLEPDYLTIPHPTNPDETVTLIIPPTFDPKVPYIKSPYDDEGSYRALYNTDMDLSEGIDWAKTLAPLLAGKTPSSSSYPPSIDRRSKFPVLPDNMRPAICKKILLDPLGEPENPDLLEYCRDRQSGPNQRRTTTLAAVGDDLPRVVESQTTENKQINSGALSFPTRRRGKAHSKGAASPEALEGAYGHLFESAEGQQRGEDRGRYAQGWVPEGGGGGYHWQGRGDWKRR